MISKINRWRRHLWDRFHLAKLRRHGSLDPTSLIEEMDHSSKLQQHLPRRATSKSSLMSRTKCKELREYAWLSRMRLSTQINSRPQLIPTYFSRKTLLLNYTICSHRHYPLMLNCSSRSRDNQKDSTFSGTSMPTSRTQEWSSFTKPWNSPTWASTRILFSFSNTDAEKANTEDNVIITILRKVVGHLFQDETVGINNRLNELKQFYERKF